MRSLAIQPEKVLECGPCCGPSVSCEHSRKPYYPELYIDAKQMPEINAMDVGEEYLITFKVKPRSLSKRETMDDEVDSSASLELLEYEMKKVAKEDKDDNDGDD